LICLTPDHHAVETLEGNDDGRYVFDAAVQNE
jgi:hypothetical protein